MRLQRIPLARRLMMIADDHNARVSRWVAQRLALQLERVASTDLKCVSSSAFDFRVCGAASSHAALGNSDVLSIIVPMMSLSTRWLRPLLLHTDTSGHRHERMSILHEILELHDQLVEAARPPLGSTCDEGAMAWPW